MKLPKITILIVTLNNEFTISECIRRVKHQDYPVSKIEYLAVDGGSTDKTVSILESNGFEVIASPILRNAEAQRGVGVSRAKHNIIVSVDADNFLPTKDWIKQMVQPFLDDPKIIHANTMHYGYRKSDSIFNRYVSLFGMADPVVYYVGKPDRLPLYKKNWEVGKIVSRNNAYTLVDFDEKTLPTVGCNGVVYRRDILLNHAKSSPKEFLHIDVFADAIKAGYNRFAIVNNTVIHYTAVSITHLMRKRLLFLNSYYIDTSKRRYLIFDPKKMNDRIKLLLFILYTITFVKPVYDSFKGYAKIRDIAWFVHPFVCWIYLITYGYATIKGSIYKEK